MGILAAQAAIDVYKGPKFSVRQGTGRRFLARAELADGTDILQSHFDGTGGSIACAVRNAAGTSVYANATLTVASVVYNTLQTDALWTEDSDGYNFAFSVPASAFSTVGYRHVLFTFTPETANGNPAFALEFEGTVT